MKKNVYHILCCYVVMISTEVSAESFTGICSATTDGEKSKAELAKESHCDNIYMWVNSENVYLSIRGGNRFKSLNNSSRNLEGIAGTTIRVIGDNMLPYIVASNYSNILGGYLGDVWEIIEKTLKIRSQITTYDYDTGVEKMIQEQADVMLAAAIQKPGQHHIEYSQPYFYNWYHLYIKKPEPTASSSSYVKIFSDELWLATIILLAILTTSLWFTLKLLREATDPKTSLFSCLLIVAGGFLNQGFELKISSHSGRIQVFLSLVIGYLLYSAMNAVLVARLANLEVILPFTSLNDVAIQRTHSLCLRTNSFVYNNFIDENRTIVAPWGGILNGKGCLNINDQSNLAKIVCNDGLIFLENRVVMSTVIRNNQLPCQLTYHAQKYFIRANSFIVRKEFKNKIYINQIVQKLRSSGVLRRLENRWIRNYKIPTDHISAVPQVTIDHIIGVLQLFVGIVICSLGILILEVAYSRSTPQFPYVN